MRKKLVWMIGAYLFVAVLLIGFTPRKISWLDYFSNKSKDPYGLFIFKDLISDIFPDVSLNSRAIYTLKDKASYNENYIFITDELRFSEDERNSLFEWVSNGNNVFIAANSFPYSFLDSLKIDDRYINVGFNQLTQSNIFARMANDEKKYSFEKQFDITGFVNKYDSIKTITPLAFCISKEQKENTIPIFVHSTFGEGNIFLCSLPYAFTNYYLLKNNNYEFASNLLSYLPKNKTYYDSYYQPQSSKEPALKVFLSTPAFRWAAFLGLTLLLLYIIFNIKRKQNYIPIIQPPENRSLEFTKTIGDLYYNTFDLNDLVNKMERHFKEYIRQKYRIDNYIGTEEQTNKLMLKSGKKIGLISSINTLFKRNREIYTSGAVNEETVQLLNKKLQEFYDGR